MNNLLAPIALFAYNRPLHTKAVLDSLALNIEAKDSILYVFCDGTKENATSDILAKIEEVRNIVKSENRFKEVIIEVQKSNKGLANSIIDGVTKVVNIHKKIIVLEDDLILSPFFLDYMNDSLIRYKTYNKVAQIGGCNFYACGNQYPQTFFLPIPDCWGWATWKDRWDFFNSDAVYLLNEIKSKKLEFKFDGYGSYDMMTMLEKQAKGIGNSWAIRWQAVCILNDWLTLYPSPSMANHIESSEATHANVNICPPLSLKKQDFETIEIIELPNLAEAMKIGLSGLGNNYGGKKQKNKLSFFKKYTPYLILKKLFLQFKPHNYKY